MLRYSDNSSNILWRGFAGIRFPHICLRKLYVLSSRGVQDQENDDCLLQVLHEGSWFCTVYLSGVGTGMHHECHGLATCVCDLRNSCVRQGACNIPILLTRHCVTLLLICR